MKVCRQAGSPAFTSLLVFLVLNACGQIEDNQSGLEAIEDDACYTAQAGHPTAAERTSWVNEISVYAKEAEQKYGVPAAAIVAMTALEGGYGWTKTAIGANNPFGYKFTSPESAGYRTSYTLTCQPPEDANNKYIVFSSRRDAVMFVSAKLATLDRSYSSYKTVTDNYIQARRSGASTISAVNAWIDGIADEGYNYNPTTYKAALKKISNNFHAPSTTYSASYNTYVFSGSVQPGGGSANASPPPTTGGAGTSTKITFGAPVSGQTVAGDVSLKVTAPSGTTSVKFFSKPAAGGSWYQITIDQSAPFAINWATAGNVPNGSYILRAEAWNGTTYLDVTEITVSVSN